MKYVFTGTVYPERAWVSISKIGPIEIISENSTPIGTLVVTVLMSQVTVLLNSADNNTDIFTIKNGMQCFVERIMASFDYTQGYYHNVDIKQCTDEYGNVTVFGVSHPAISNRFANTDDSLSKILNSDNGYGSFQVQSALLDISKGIQFPNDTFFYCYRAIETLRQHLERREDIHNAKTAWGRFHDITGVTKPDFKHLLHFANKERHGTYVEASADDRDRALLFTHKIIEKYINYLLASKGLSPLLPSASEDEPTPTTEPK